MKRIPVLTTLTAFLALWTIAVFGLVPSEAEAAVPTKINYQGQLRDGSGNIVPDNVYTLAFKIYSVASGGISLWFETLPVQVTGGLFNVVLGNSTPLDASIFPAGADRYLGVTVNLDPEISPRTQLVSVAYAIQADEAGTAALAQDLTCTGCVGAGEIAAGAVGSVEVGNGSLIDDDLADEPGVASVRQVLSNIIMDGTIQTLLSRSISAPASGYVLAIATTTVSMSHTNGGVTSGFLGVSTAAGTFSPNEGLAFQVPSTAPSGTYGKILTVHGLFPVGAGLNSFYFVGQKVGPGGVFVNDRQLALIYFPTAYGTVDTP